jgi:16S rRNA processing protein RimM
MPDASSRILMGRIGAAHGIKGEVRIQSFTDDPMALVEYRTFATNKPGVEITIDSARTTTNVLIARLRGIADRNAAERLNGVELYVDRARLPEVEDEDDYYLADLIGLAATDVAGTSLGKVLAVQNYGAGDILEIGGAGLEVRLIPFTKAAVPSVDILGGRLTIVLPDEVEGEPENAAVDAADGQGDRA